MVVTETVMSSSLETAIHSHPICCLVNTAMIWTKPCQIMNRLYTLKMNLYKIFMLFVTLVIKKNANITNGKGP